MTTIVPSRSESITSSCCFETMASSSCSSIFFLPTILCACAQLYNSFRGISLKMASSMRGGVGDFYGGYGAYGYSYTSFGDESASKKRKLMGTSICVDYLRGVCKKGARCDQAHADHIPDLDDREALAKSKFCHDFQNRGVCARGTCRFLHVTRREEDEFLLTGNIAQSIFQRNSERGQSDNPGSYSDNRSLQGLPRQSPTFPVPRDDYYTRFDQYQYNSSYPSYEPPPPHDYHAQRWKEESAPFRRQSRGGDGFAAKDSFSYSQPVTVSNYCIDNLKGTCAKGKECRLLHMNIVENKEDRESIVKTIFCHDFLNKRCPRTYCKYLHANYDEQKGFIERGFFPESLCARNKSKLFFCDICIDYLRSQCMRGAGCQHRHVDRVDSRDERICLSRSIFCHDFQDGICSRPVCKLFHTGKGDEEFFIETGCLPEHLRRRGGPNVDPSIEEISETVCRDFLKGMCNRGVSCKYYHPSPEESRKIISYQKARRMHKGGASMGRQPHTPMEGKPLLASQDEYAKLQKTNEELKQRVEQLERLLSDACHCLTVAVGDQNPAIKALMQSIGLLMNQDGLLAEPAIGANNM